MVKLCHNEQLMNAPDEFIGVVYTGSCTTKLLQYVRIECLDLQYVPHVYCH